MKPSLNPYSLFSIIFGWSWIMSITIASAKILVFGRAGMDIYADPPGTKVAETRNFFASLGGSAANIAVGISKLGGHASLISAVSDDAVGRFVLNSLREFGVDCSCVATIGGECRTSLAVTETRIEDTQNVIYRNNAADFLVTPVQIEQLDFSNYGALILTGTALAIEPSRDAALKAIELARVARIPVLLDIDYRPYSWESGECAAKIYQDAAYKTDFIVGNDDEFAVMAGHYEDGYILAKKLAIEWGKVVLYKLGPKGSIIFDSDGQCYKYGIFTTKAKKPTGSGDSFMATFVMALANKKTLQEAVIMGSGAAALVVAGIGCSAAMPTTAELEDFLTSHDIGEFDEKLFNVVGDLTSLNLNFETIKVKYAYTTS